jgi:hypothetical protein
MRTGVWEGSILDADRETIRMLANTKKLYHINVIAIEAPRVALDADSHQ